MTQQERVYVVALVETSRASAARRRGVLGERAFGAADE